MKAKVFSGFTILTLLAALFIAVVPAGADGPPIGPPDEFPRNNMAPSGPKMRLPYASWRRKLDLQRQPMPLQVELRLQLGKC